MQRRPRIIAHRGASAYAPENTMAAFVLAHAQQADMLELDVQQSADGVLVAFHDHTTLRWNGRPDPVSACSLQQLRTLDIGGERVATLEEVCAFARDANVALNVELKQPGIAAPAVALLRRYGLAGQTLISSFHAADLVALQRLAPDIPTGYLMGTQTYRLDVRLREFWPFLALRWAGVVAWHPACQLPWLGYSLPLVRRAGYAVNVWTVDAPDQMRQLVTWGATGIITNRPDLARQCLDGV